MAGQPAPSTPACPDTSPRSANGKPWRGPDTVDGVELWRCSAPDCGWHPVGDFYQEPNGHPLFKCKRCFYEHQVGDEAGRQRHNATVAASVDRLWQQRDPDGYARAHSHRERVARGVRLCLDCKREFPLAEFKPTAARPNGGRATCSECGNVRARARGKAARLADPEPNRAQNRARKARIRGAAAGVKPVTRAEWAAICEAYDDCCAFCGRRCHRQRHVTADKLTQEHLTPVSRGGAHTAVNVVPACYQCNATKRDLTVAEWGRPVDLRPHPFWRGRLP